MENQNIRDLSPEPHTDPELAEAHRQALEEEQQRKATMSLSEDPALQTARSRDSLKETKKPIAAPDTNEMEAFRIAAEEEAARKASLDLLENSQTEDATTAEESARSFDMKLKAEEEAAAKQAEEEAALVAQKAAEEAAAKKAEEEEAERIKAAIRKAEEEAAAKRAEEEAALVAQKAAEEAAAKKAEEEEAERIREAIRRAEQQAAAKRAEEEAALAAQKAAEEAAAKKAEEEEAERIRAAIRRPEHEAATKEKPSEEQRDTLPRSSSTASLTPPRTPEPTSSRLGTAASSGGLASWSGSRGSLRSSFDRLASPAPISAPLNRTTADGPVVPLSAVTAAVRATNPILDELLHAIKLLSENDPSLTVLDLKDCKVFTVAHGNALAAALAGNTHLKDLNLNNTKLQTSTAVDLAEALKINRSLEILNLENNQVGPQGIKALAESLEKNSTLLELRLANQKSPAGTDAEQAFARSLQKNETLVKLGLLFRDVASRNFTDRAITRNKEIARKARLATK
ncbi:hypothetical protein HDU97_008109 [Phlyctochytrium planicorne]|nr:hypothetical protein HDU97_008109 [Phlyctochytrium planicorne]